MRSLARAFTQRVNVSIANTKSVCETVLVFGVPVQKSERPAKAAQMIVLI